MNKGSDNEVENNSQHCCRGGRLFEQHDLLIGSALHAQVATEREFVARVVGAKKSYVTRAGAVRGLDDFSIELYHGEICALTGISGSGKSTLLGVLGGLEPLDDGSVTVCGIDVAELSGAALARYRRESVAMVYQEYNLLPMLTISENVSVPGFLVGVAAEQAEASARDALGAVGLDELADRYPGQVSGGQRQRAAIARAIAGAASAGKSVLLADEPTGSLDRATGAGVMSAFRSAADAGLGVLIATHDPEVVALSDRVVGIRDGRNVDARQLSKSAVT